MYEKTSLKEDFNPLPKIFNYFKYKFNFKKTHPLYFYPDGLLVFVGPQGSGKTLSAVNYVYNLMDCYPNCILVTNLYLTDFPFDNERVFEFKNNDDLSRYENGEHGVIYLIDEIQLYLNSLNSKNINMDVMTQISQQRKQRKHIVCTSQNFSRLAKPLREQFSNVVKCSNVFGFLQVNQVINRDDIEEDDNYMSVKGKVSYVYRFIHTPSYFKRYDTYYVINQNKKKFVSAEKRGTEIYGNINTTIIKSSN